jgi:hypothetical protein
VKVLPNRCALASGYIRPVIIREHLHLLRRVVYGSVALESCICFLRNPYLSCTRVYMEVDAFHLSFFTFLGVSKTRVKKLLTHF